MTATQLRGRATDADVRFGRMVQAVCDLLGHASPTTTARYTAVADERLAEVVRSIA